MQLLGVIDLQLFMVISPDLYNEILIEMFLDWAQLTFVLASNVVHKLWWSDLVPLQYVCK
jgi:hypothetical protein